MVQTRKHLALLPSEVAVVAGRGHQTRLILFLRVSVLLSVLTPRPRLMPELSSDVSAYQRQRRMDQPGMRPSRDRETIQFASNEFGFRNGFRKGDGTLQCFPCLIRPVQLLEQRAAQPVKIEVSIQLAL